MNTYINKFSLYFYWYKWVLLSFNFLFSTTFCNFPNSLKRFWCCCPARDLLIISRILFGTSQLLGTKFSISKKRYSDQILCPDSLCGVERRYHKKNFRSNFFRCLQSAKRGWVSIEASNSNNNNSSSNNNNNDVTGNENNKLIEILLIRGPIE